jgi:hypothetical protein
MNPPLGFLLDAEPVVAMPAVFAVLFPSGAMRSVLNGGLI